MSEAIKSISLDDVGGFQGQGKEAPKTNVMYHPQYGGTSDQFQTSTNAASELDKSLDAPPMSTGPESSFGTSITRMTDIFGRFDSSNNLRNYAIVGALVLALIAALYLTSGDGTQSPLSTLLRQFDLLTHQSPEAPADDTLADNPAPPFPNEAPVTAPASAIAQPAAPTELVNPYWSLPNPLEASPELSAQSVLTPSQENRWRQGLAHPFIWQRHKTVIEMRQSRLKGSQFLLNDALAQPKFWTRMEALLALAELGEMLDIDTVESGIGSSRRSLIQNYFRRFRKQSTGGELYIMRQAIRIVDAGSRKIILENLAQLRNPVNDLYLVAGSFDPSASVHEWAQEELRVQPVAEAVQNRFQQIVSGREPQEAQTPGASPNKVQDLKVEQLPTEVNVEEVYFLKDEDKQQEKTQSKPFDDGFQQLEKQPGK